MTVNEFELSDTGLHGDLSASFNRVRGLLETRNHPGPQWSAEVVPTEQADRTAVALGTHPACLWPNHWHLGC